MKVLREEMFPWVSQLLELHFFHSFIFKASSISSSLSLHYLHFVLSSLIKSPCASLLQDTCDCILDPFSNLGKSYHLRILNYIEVTLTNSRNWRWLSLEAIIQPRTAGFLNGFQSKFFVSCTGSPTPPLSKPWNAFRSTSFIFLGKSHITFYLTNIR